MTAARSNSSAPLARPLLPNRHHTHKITTATQMPLQLAPPSASLPLAARSATAAAARSGCSQRRSRARSSRIAAAASSSAAAPRPPAPAAHAADPHSQLAALAGASGPVKVGRTARGRGLVVRPDAPDAAAAAAGGGAPERSELLNVPLANALVIADAALESISITSDRQHRAWQASHGPLPEPLLDFLTGSARWDARMAAWLLWICRQQQRGGGGGGLWGSYLALLPRELELSCLLNYSAAEAEALQLPALVEEARVQADWAAHLHAKHFDARTGSLAGLQLSASLADSLWALGLVRSRTFSEDVGGEALTLMVPYCDLANHDNSPNATFCLSRDNKSFQLRSLEPLAPGDEVTICYGADKTNSELLRDYGFVLSGNTHDRLQLGAQQPPSSGSSSGSAAGGGLPRLNAACLLEAAGFSGDLTTGDIAAAAAAAAGRDEAQLGRRQAALLSMPLQPAVGGAGSQQSGGLFDWLTAASQPWTDSGRPPPQPLRPGQRPAERAAVSQLQAVVRQQLAALPTSIETDQQLLHACAEAEASCASSSSTVQQRRAARLQHPAASKGVDGRQGGGARLASALRARLEHKLLLSAALELLDDYDAYLTAA